MTYRTDTYLKKFWQRVEKTNSCWIWTGRKNCYGYGDLNWYGRRSSAHRVAYELLRGPIPAGLVIDHLCRVRDCVNPDHMEPVTNAENVLRGISQFAICARRTHCPKGHPYDNINTITDSEGARRCRECERVKNRAYNALRYTCPECGADRNWSKKAEHFRRHHAGIEPPTQRSAA